MDLWRSVIGTVTVQIISADPSKVLSLVHSRNIELENVRFVDELTITFTVRRSDWKKIKTLTEKRGEMCKILHRTGIYWHFHALLQRKVLVAGMLFFALLTVFLPTRIFFFKVEGNVTVPTNQILELASECGIRFGASRKEVRSEKVKNTLLSAAPQLEWAGINTSGCVAIISVGERQGAQETPVPQGVSSIVAVRDGVVRDLTVTGGSAACKVGQAVKTGQVLISGYTDCGLSIRAGRAKGEIYADTIRSFSFLLPENTASRGEVEKKIQKYSLIIGKKRINFFKDSGILDSSCVKMYVENYLTLPGGFILPVALVTETWTFCQESVQTAPGDTQGTLTEFAEKYLQRQMVAGSVLTRQEEFTNENGAGRLDGVYACLEMIGRERNEEIIKP